MDFGVVKDKLKSVEKKLALASNKCDLLLTTGGVSVGDADFIKNALKKLGKVNFWKIAVKPGRPLAFGKIKKCFFFGLPGNPVSVVVTFNLFVNAAIRKITGQKNNSSLSLTAKLQSVIKKRRGRKEYKRGILTIDNGEFFVKSSGAQGSNILSSLKDANCYIELAEHIDKIKEGENVKVIPFALSSEHYE
jgi:molybdopterin molybdotransferase